MGEEALFSFQTLFFARSFDFLDEKPVYFYVNHENSQSKLRNSDPWGGTVDTIKAYLEKVDLYIDYADTINAFNATATIVSLDRIEKMYKGKIKNQEARKRVTKFKETLDASVNIDTNNISYKVKVLLPFLKTGIYEPILIASKVRAMIGHKE